jgi:peptide methionine sulfoxide reductase MsrB
MANSKTETAFVTEYIEKEGHAIHDVFAVGSSFNESKSRYEAKEKHQ